MLGEANFSDHGANRLGASALMQGLADGYFVAPYTVANYLGGATLPPVTAVARRVRRRQGRGPGAASTRCCRSRASAPCASSTAPSAPSAGITSAWPAPKPAWPARSPQIRQLREEFWQDVTVPGDANNLNPGLDYAGRVADYMEFAEVLALDALERRESCGGHFREEFQTPDGEALRKDDEYSYVAAWEFKGVGARPELHKEALVFEEVHPTQRSYK